MGARHQAASQSPATGSAVTMYIFTPVGRKVKNGDLCGSAMLLSIDASFASEGKMAHEEARMTHLPSKIHDVFMSAHKNTTTARQLASVSFSLNSEMSFL